jgi:hypothetical protein
VSSLVHRVASEASGVPPKLAAARPSTVIGNVIGLVVVAVAGGALFLFNPAQHAFYPQCFFHQVTGWQCPGCGGLRAMHQLLHGHFLTALHFNALAVGSLPVFGWLLAREFFARRRGVQARRFVSIRSVCFGVAVLLVFSLLRNIPAFAFLSP